MPDARSAAASVQPARAVSPGLLSYMAGEGGYEQVAFWYDRATGLRAIIAIYDTTLGPSLGGVRMYPYATEDQAVVDVLRLAKAMAYKNAAAGLNLGGGKAVIIGDPAREKSEALFRSFGRFVHSQGGRYYTATDVGTTYDDMVFVRMETPYVTGVPEIMGGGGDTSANTALGIWEGIQVCVREALRREGVAGLRASVQGTGKVGARLAEHLVGGGAIVTVCDTDEGRLERLRSRFPIQVVAPEEIYDVPCDIFAPCALGAVINDETIPRLRCAIVAGGANNQLAEERHGAILQERGILYAPDFVINAGGVINCYDELEGYRPERAAARTRNIARTLEQVFQLARSERIPTSEAANHVAEERMRVMAAVHRTYKPERV
ncbi:MAG: Glu/Leu/Phe/Val dehydrogenase [Chloroflexi bacterium]|nr:Glu/Leu/Phe/Val dehydrogenase [Chloroflexota bacterium]